jgi:hypothetical protein
MVPARAAVGKLKTAMAAKSIKAFVMVHFPSSFPIPIWNAGSAISFRQWNQVGYNRLNKSSQGQVSELILNWDI